MTASILMYFFLLSDEELKQQKSQCQMHEIQHYVFSASLK